MLFSNLALTKTFICFQQTNLQTVVCFVLHSISISILFLLDKPKVSLKLGRNIEMDRIKEGEDIYMECSVDSRPEPYKLFFRHQVAVTMTNIEQSNILLKTFLGSRSRPQQARKEDCFPGYSCHSEPYKTRRR